MADVTGVGGAGAPAPPDPASRAHWQLVCVGSAAGRSTMLRAVISRALPRLSRPPVCHYSAAAIPAPSGQPEVHFDKVQALANTLIQALLDVTLDIGQLRNKCVLMQSSMGTGNTVEVRRD